MRFDVRPLAVRALIPAVAATLLAPPAGAERAAWVVGANDGSLARVDLDAGTVTGHVATVGTLANRVAADPDARRAAIVCSGSATVHLLDFATGSIERTVSLPAGSNPWDAEFVSGRLFVSSLLQDALFVLDPDDGTLLATLPVGVAPEGMCASGGLLFVADSGFRFSTFTWDPGQVSVVDPVSLTVVDTIPVGLNPQECVRAADGRVHVVCTGDFGTVQGHVDVIDPVTRTIVAARTVPGYPGTADLGGPVPVIFLGVTTPSFSSAVLSYDPGSLDWLADPAHPLLPSFDFYGNLRASAHGEVLVCDFAADLLLVERPAAPGSPAACLVGDGPVDLAIDEGESPVGLAMSGLSAIDAPDGVRLSWHATPETGVASFAVSRRDAGEPERSLAARVAVSRDPLWVDRSAPVGPELTYAVAARDAGGRVLDRMTVSLVRRPRVPAVAGIRAIAPNPARGTARIEFEAPSAAAASIEVIDVAGRRLVRRDLGTVPPGTGRTDWDGRADDGSVAPPGFYLVRLHLDDAVTTGRLLRIR